MNNNAAYSVAKITPEKVFIIDRNDESPYSKTVTNDAENVVDTLLKIYPDKRIIYRDTDCQWDELLHDGVKFTGFKLYEDCDMP